MCPTGASAPILWNSRSPTLGTQIDGPFGVIPMVACSLRAAAVSVCALRSPSTGRSRMTLRRALVMCCRVGLSFCLLLLLIGDSAAAQALQADTADRLETRAELEAQASLAEKQGRAAETLMIRKRLKEGDFREGDRILLGLQSGNQVIGLPSTGDRMDTLVVRTGDLIHFPQIADLSLEGVLRSELAQRMTAHLAQYVRDPVVRVMPLLRIGVLGHAVRPSYYYTPADVPLTDLLEEAGGATADGDLGDVTIRRAGSVILNPDQVRAALASGVSLDRLHLRAGDDLYVGSRSQFPWLATTQVTATLLALIVAVVKVR